MDRIAVFIDAGYLFAQGATALCGTKLPRSRLELGHEEVVRSLEAFAREVSGLPLLRIYWYDGTSQGPSAQHIALAYQSGVKVRLGFVNSVGQQKGVDSLIVTDMITLARNRAMSECVLLSGDEDLRVGVQQAQEYGVRVHLVGIKPARGSQSTFLLQEADATYEWDDEDLSPFLSVSSDHAAESGVEVGLAPRGADQAHLGDDIDQLLDRVAEEVANDVAAPDLEGLIASIKATGQRPRDLDGRLLAKSRAALGRELESADKSAVRGAFLSVLEARVRDRASDESTPPSNGDAATFA